MSGINVNFIMSHRAHSRCRRVANAVGCRIGEAANLLLAGDEEAWANVGPMKTNPKIKTNERREK